ncbi:MAG: tol-pal system protein YbgF [Kiloniellales bacterium]
MSARIRFLTGFIHGIRIHGIRRTARGASLAVAAIVLVLGLQAGPASAQDADIQSLVNQIERLQRELSTLQRQVYRGQTPPAPAAGASAEAGGLSTTSAARIDLRLSQFESELRSLTGQVEEVTFRHSQLRERLERLAADMDLRLQRLEQGAPPVVAGQGAAGGQLAATPGARSFDTEPKVIGTIDPNQLQALQTQGVEQASPGAQAGQLGAAAQQTASLAYPLQGDSPQERYQHAFGLLSQANYGEAELALRAFLGQHPKDPLAGNAKYWLGETYYVRQDYQQAAVTFAEAYQEYPDNTKAPDNLLKLGMSLAALGNKSDACGTYIELLRRYPDAAATVMQRAKQERQRLTCP